MEKNLQTQPLDEKLFEFSNTDHADNEEIKGKSVGFWQGAMRRLVKQKISMISLILIVIFVAGAIIIPWGKDAEIKYQDPKIQNLPPKIPGLSSLGIFDGTRNGVDVYAQKGVTRDYYFGTDDLGRDLWLRVWAGLRTSLLIALIVTTVEFVLGAIIGGISGYFGKTADMVIQRVLDVLVNIPVLIVLLIVSMAMGQGFWPLVLGLSFTAWIGFSRLVRAQILKYKDHEFVLASRTLGANHKRIIFDHLFPNMVSVFIVALALDFPAVILSEAFYTLLGLGLPAGEISLGQLIVENVGKLQTFPYQLIIPTVFMGLISLTFNLIGNGLRDALDPKLKDR
ncbi:ABC transporter permease [Culicoidibacter larvae]|uniref:ABC transporter permease n=1 Tax=Culicoidibacter larvae TaxID=2579976 RepID=A0A5R8QB71_9FIRM|nr:ABC transporter permease [Culicoidibacter larvae]TLG73829.1 ABC transporter permease [Culicoidibacter larvae]